MITLHDLSDNPNSYNKNATDIYNNNNNNNNNNGGICGRQNGTENVVLNALVFPYLLLPQKCSKFTFIHLSMSPTYA